MPVDDDDRFAPDLGRWLSSGDTCEVEGLRWRPAVIQVPTSLRHRLQLWRARLTPAREWGWICATNSYAIRKGPMGLEEWLHHHQADCCFRSHPAITVVQRMHGLLMRLQPR